MELGQLRRLLIAEDFKTALNGNLWPTDLAHVKGPLVGCITGGYNGAMLAESGHSWSYKLNVEGRSTKLPVSGRWLAILRQLTDWTQEWYHMRTLHLEAAQFSSYSHTWETHPTKKARNSLVLVKSNGTPRPAIIRCIAAPLPDPSTPKTVYLVIQCFRQLSDIDNLANPYRYNSVRLAVANSFERFAVCYAELEEPIVIAAHSLICHVGYTPYHDLSVPAAVFTSLGRVSPISTAMGGRC